MSCFGPQKIYFYPVNYKKKLCGGWLVMSSRGRRKEKTKVDQGSLTQWLTEIWFEIYNSLLNVLRRNEMLKNKKIVKMKAFLSLD